MSYIPTRAQLEIEWVQLRELQRDCRRIMREHDELVAALQELCETLGECGATEKARALIAKCERPVEPPKPPEQSIPGIEVIYLDATPRPAYWRS